MITEDFLEGFQGEELADFLDEFEEIYPLTDLEACRLIKVTGKLVQPGLLVAN